MTALYQAQRFGSPVCWPAQGAQSTAVPQLGSQSGAGFAPSTGLWQLQGVPSPSGCWGQQCPTGVIILVLRAPNCRNPKHCYWVFHPVQAHLVLLTQRALSPFFMVIPQAVKMKFFSSLVSLKLLCFPGRTSQEFPIICREISYNCEMNFINKANNTVEFKTCFLKNF